LLVPLPAPRIAPFADTSSTRTFRNSELASKSSCLGRAATKFSHRIVKRLERAFQFTVDFIFDVHHAA